MPGDEVRQNDADTYPAFSNIEEIISDIRDGKMVIIVDDESRENEGDLLMAAARVRPDDINYMARFRKGDLLSKPRCKSTAKAVGAGFEVFHFFGRKLDFFQCPAYPRPRG